MCSAMPFTAASDQREALRPDDRINPDPKTRDPNPQPQPPTPRRAAQPLAVHCIAPLASIIPENDRGWATIPWHFHTIRA
jgi:hypothetical protein